MEQVWLQQLTEDSLLRELPPPLSADIRDLDASGLTPEQIGVMLAAQPGTGVVTRSLGGTAAELWSRLAVELRLLICTDDPKYHDVRSNLGKESQVTGAVVLALVSSAMSARLGVEAGMITPFVVLLLMTLLRTTKEAWCTQIADHLDAASESPSTDQTHQR